MAVGVFIKLATWGKRIDFRCDIYNNGELLYLFFIRMQEAKEIDG